MKKAVVFGLLCAATASSATYAQQDLEALEYRFDGSRTANAALAQKLNAHLKFYPDVAFKQADCTRVTPERDREKEHKLIIICKADESTYNRVTAVYWDTVKPKSPLEDVSMEVQAAAMLDCSSKRCGTGDGGSCLPKLCSGTAICAHASACSHACR